MATVLGLDTATADTAVAVTREGKALAQRLVGPDPSGRPRHSAALLGEAEAAVASAGGWSEIELIVVGTGPGSFTGLRIGVATARALAQSLNLPLAGVPSLEALARAIGEHPEADGRMRLAAIDARRGQLFAYLADSSGEAVFGALVDGPEGVAKRLSDAGVAPLAAGDGALRFRSDLEAAGADVPPDEDPVHHIAARHLCALGEGPVARRPEEIEPLYLRPPDAEIWLERDHR